MKNGDFSSIFLLGNKKGSVSFRVFALSFLMIFPLHAAENSISGDAYGTDHDALKTAPSIVSQSSTNGMLTVGYEGTTNVVVSHQITGYLYVTNKVKNFTIDATGGAIRGHQGVVFAVFDATNMTVRGGSFLGVEGVDSSLPPIPGLPIESNTTVATGGFVLNSSITFDGTTFSGTNQTPAMVAERSAFILTNTTFTGGSTGEGLIMRDHSSLTIHSGNFSGGAGQPALLLENSDATILGGSFAGNIGGTEEVEGSGLLSKLSANETARTRLEGGTFSSIAFLNEDQAVQEVFLGENLTVEQRMLFQGGTFWVENHNDAALQNTTIRSALFSASSSSVSLLDSGHLLLDFDENKNTLLFAQTLYIHTNAFITVDTTDIGFAPGVNDLTILSTSNGVFIGSVLTNRPALDNDFSTNNLDVLVSGRNALRHVFVDEGRNVRVQLSTLSLSEYWEADGQMALFGDELEQLASPEMLAIIDSYPTPESSQKAIEEAYFLMPNTFQTALMGLDAAIGLSTSRCTEFRDQLKLRPTGPRGPLVVNNQLRGWAKYYGQFYSHDADEQNPEYDTTLHGGMFGYDKSVGAFLFGMSGGAASYSTDTDLDAKEDTTAYHGTLYGTYGTDRLFFNGGLAYGYNQVETHTRGTFLLDGDFDAQLISGYLAAGYDFLIQKPNLVLTPEIAVRYASYEQDAYTETSSISVPRQIDGFDADSLQSRLGLNFSMLNASVFKTFSVKLEGRFHWMHEFNPDPGAMTFQLDGGTHDYQLLPPMLDEDLFRAGVGVSFFNTLRTMPKNLLFRIDFDELFGDGFNSQQLSAKVIYAF